jgi:hypothetical protein
VTKAFASSRLLAMCLCVCVHECYSIGFLLGQVVTSDNDTMSEGLDQQLQSLALARVAAGS